LLRALRDCATQHFGVLDMRELIQEMVLEVEKGLKHANPLGIFNLRQNLLVSVVVGPRSVRGRGTWDLVEKAKLISPSFRRGATPQQIGKLYDTLIDYIRY
jgi:hypothetical protein